MLTRTVPFFEYPRLWTDERETFLALIDQTACSGGFIMQKALFDFEEELARYTGARHAIGVANATDGMEIFLQALGIKAGDEVIISSHTMLATASAVIVAGGVPVPVEVGEGSLIDYDAIEDAIGPRTVGIMPTQLNGRTCNMDCIQAIADRHGLFVCEDSAQALGSKFKGRCAGTFGKAGDISFFPAKVLGCLGDAGAILTNDDELADTMYQIHDHGRDREGEVRRWGRNSRLDTIQAAILLHKLGGYRAVIDRRRAVAAQYQERLGAIEALVLPPPPNDGDHYDVFQNYELQADRRDDLRDHLKQQGIGTLVQWGGKAIHQFHELGFKTKLPVTDEFFTRCLMLPMNVFISDEDVDYICDVIGAFYGERS